jgi:hypothetical protein
LRTDSQLDDLAEKYCNSHRDGHPEIFFAREGMEVKI